ncbi:hypothetical protein QFC21_005678 [Naganishia friedmannii]|uniref:Uncharacterized protein n=1 Tax=Naganishia friedmannii TaxID=89922 RepID=A0ACC2V9U2_9TREE|nr:hypothetical protein QFC21_005678 [Naganishia friedmannii]
MFTTIFSRTSPVFRRTAFVAPSSVRGISGTSVVRSAMGYGDPPLTEEAQGGKTPEAADAQKDAKKDTSSSSSSSSSDGPVKGTASTAGSSGDAVSKAPDGGKVSTQGTEHGAQGNGPDPQAANHMGEEGGGKKPPSQQETKKVGEKPKPA